MDEHLYYDDVMSAVLDHVYKDGDISHLAQGVHDGTDRLVQMCYLARSDGDMTDYTRVLLEYWTLFVTCESKDVYAGGSTADYCASAVIGAFAGYELSIADEYYDDVIDEIVRGIEYGDEDGSFRALYPERELDVLREAGLLH